MPCKTSLLLGCILSVKEQGHHLKVRLRLGRRWEKAKIRGRNCAYRAALQVHFRLLPKTSQHTPIFFPTVHSYASGCIE